MKQIVELDDKLQIVSLFTFLFIYLFKSPKVHFMSLCHFMSAHFDCQLTPRPLVLM